MIGAATRRLVRSRAGDRCEYCRTPQDAEPFITYQIEHVIPRQHEGGDEDSNLALACSHCNLHKGPNLTGIDDETGAIAPLFHPRRDRWDDHFEYRGSMCVGTTPTGRATVRVLKINRGDRVRLRDLLGER